MGKKNRQRRNNPKFEQEREQKAQPIHPKNHAQRDYLRALRNKIVVVPTGSAGTGKTFIASSHAANMLIRGDVDNVVLSRPYVAMGRSSGFFPGTVYEKLEPYLKPMLNVFRKKLGDNDYECRVRQGSISIQAMEAIRGMSFEDTVVIIDEAQNTTPDEIKSITTRIGENCQLIVCGDPHQTDIKGENGLDFLTDIILSEGVNQAEVIIFKPEDIVRSGITKRFVQIYDKLGGSNGK